MNAIDSTLPSIYSSLGDDPDLAHIVEWFVREMPDRMTALRDQAAAKDWQALRGTAHQLKGAGGSYGFAAVSPCAGRLESAISEGATEDQIRVALDELLALCQRLRAGAEHDVVR
jgi:histidine phosphotransfer protein HptB